MNRGMTTCIMTCIDALSTLYVYGNSDTWISFLGEQTARQAVEGKIGEMRKNGYNFAADALVHFLSNAGHNIDLSQHANEISSNIFWQRSFIASVLAKLREKDPKPDNFIKRSLMIPTMQQLINLSTWNTELCPTTKVEVQNNGYGH